MIQLYTYDYFLFGVSLITLISYLSYVIIRFGIPPSLSDSYYLLNRKLNSIFTIVLWVVGFSALPVCIDVTGKDINIIPFLTIAGLLLVGTAPKFKETEKKVHTLGALISIVFSQLWVSTTSGVALTLLVWIPVIILFAYIIYERIKFKKRVDYAFHNGYYYSIDYLLNKYKFIFFAEMACFFTIFASLFIKLFQL